VWSAITKTRHHSNKTMAKKYLFAVVKEQEKDTEHSKQNNQEK
jgi:hypothetical protein